MIEVKLNIPRELTLIEYEGLVLAWGKTNTRDYAGLATAFRNLRLQLENDFDFLSIFKAGEFEYINVELFNKDDALKLKLMWG